jgi:carboxymethylenebutenolidase
VRAPDGTPFRAYLVGEEQPARPAIIMFPPIFGADADARAIAGRWAGRGYVVAVPDYFFRSVPGVLDRSETGRKAAMERWKSLDVDRAMTDMSALKDYLLSRPSCNGALAALGFCAGGELAFLAATRLGATAVATFHATHIDRHLDEADKIAGRITLHYGGNDSLVPIEQVDAIRKRLASDSRVDVHVYAGAGHGFSFSTQPSYHEIAATESDRRAQQVLGRLAG